MDSVDKAKVIGIDIFSAVFAAGCVAPGIAIIDQGLVKLLITISYCISFLYFLLISCDGESS